MTSRTKIIPYEPACCQACGANLDQVEGGVVSRCQEIEIPEKPAQIIEHQCLEKQCPGCGCRNRGQWPAYLRQAQDRFRGGTTRNP